MREYILAIDQGTTGTTAIIFDHQGRPVCRGYQEFTQYYPQPGWVEHDPEEIGGLAWMQFSKRCTGRLGLMK